MMTLSAGVCGCLLFFLMAAEVRGEATPIGHVLQKRARICGPNLPATIRLVCNSYYRSPPHKRSRADADLLDDRSTPIFAFSTDNNPNTRGFTGDGTPEGDSAGMIDSKQSLPSPFLTQMAALSFIKDLGSKHRLKR
ncbi:PREDICTED: uncharacterized protein LOC106816643, partial [Priapulus caudatus]|uniref:Uncharacterized protein LOC106816643 n=1 Tax=Priapulus caudatus TaxID=37621 RepID=A0ABM1EX33_PRICU